jgi:methionyl-tRNA formyltransferase
MGSKLKVYFLGSGTISVPAMEALTKAENIELLGLGTQPDKPAGRKKLPASTPAGKWAEDNGWEIDKIPSVNADDFIQKLKTMNPDFLVVISFGQLLKPEILNLPSIACVNVHASLLPKYRGASPIVSAILNRDSETGVCFMKMDEGLDTGPVYSSIKYPLTGNENSDELEMALGNLAAEHIEEILTQINRKELKAIPQNNDRASYSGKIRKSNGELNWEEPADLIAAKVRAYTPWPGVSFDLTLPSKKLRLRISKADYQKDMKGQPGKILVADKKNWIVACGSGALKLEKVVPQGKKEMGGADFLRGYPLETGTVLS